MIKKLVKIPGFRNSQKAPASLKIREMVPVFKKNPAFVAEILSAWSSLQGELNQKIAVFLTQRGWEILPTDADRTRLPGFMTVWPEGDDFESLTKAFHQHYPEDHFEENDISLMIVWQSTRLPYETSSDLFSHKSGEETTDPSGAASPP